MNKTIDDYMNDPDIVNEPKALREIHAVRLMIYDEIKNMTASERTAYFNQSGEAVSKKYGFKLLGKTGDSLPDGAASSGNAAYEGGAYGFLHEN